jgi:hypothetical protein
MKRAFVGSRSPSFNVLGTFANMRRLVGSLGTAGAPALAPAAGGCAAAGPNA